LLRVRVESADFENRNWR